MKGCPPDHWRVRLLISYDGTDYHGWQRQSRQRTVQGTLEEALQKFYKKPIKLMGASRTDTGVHAVGQTAHFDAPRDPFQGDLRFALTGMTPPSIVLKQAWHAPNLFHAIADAQKKTYRYHVLNRRVPSALRCRYSHWIRFPLDVDYLNEASRFLVGKQDFKSFQTSGTKVKSTVREIMSASWERDRDSLIFTVTGNGFLKQMIRNIVGTLIDLNMNEAQPGRLQEIINARDRRKAGPTAPPQGLYLAQVYYPEELDNGCRKL
ncbi:MAG: tRNA pseudouridine(38-40) synthase TruA [Bdellovibrionaceae bacterium]|nr:tRNA pseudouridine(38-40) synthase TruA [Pseudobdellovibrionaceae bacterium]